MITKQNDISVEELIEAMSDDEKASELLARTGISRNEMIERAEAIARQLSSEISTLNVV
ncbi:MAG: hypothetical protein Q4A92_04300 [Corynebacterium sp.]|nr:hypothetical protein [Corynebacterium sp.]